MLMWQAEVDLLGSLLHPRLVRLLGYCAEEEQRLLVYEFMAEGSLEHHLFPGVSVPLQSAVLPWSTRMKIALEAAEGLYFLHEGSARPVIYRDFKASNILLNKVRGQKTSAQYFVCMWHDVRFGAFYF